MPLNQSLCIPCFKPSDVSLDSFCEFAASVGYRAVEIWSWDDSLDDLVATAKGHGLVVSSITGHDSIDHGLNDPAEFDRIERELTASLEIATKHGIPGVIAFSGARDGRQTDLEGLQTFIAAGRRLAPRAEQLGVNINLEVLNSRIDHPGYQADRIDWCLAALEGINSPRFRLLFDIYHVQIMEGDVIRKLQQAMPHIGHIHTAGNPGRRELDEGEMSYRPICQAIVDAGYEGYVGHEFFSKNRDWKSTLQKTFDLCNL